MSNIQLLKELGLTEEAIIEKVVGQIADQMLYNKLADLDYDEVDSGGSTRFRDAVDKLLKKRIDDAVNAVASKYTLPNLTDYLENLVLQETNSWGEKRGKPITFIEYLAQRADAWLREPVNHSGKAKSEDSYSWRQSSTRIAYMLDEHLNIRIKEAMTAALNNANKTIVGGLKEAVEMKLAEIKVALDVKVK